MQADARPELTILNAAGEEIASLLHDPVSAGAHRVVWDMRYPPPTAVAGATFWEESGASGPLAPPGEYQVRLTVGRTSVTRRFAIHADPRVDASVQDLQAQFALLLAIRDRLAETHATANRIAALRADIARWRTRAELAEASGGQTADQRLAAIDDDLGAIDQELIERSPGLSYAHPVRLNAKLAALSAIVGSADAAPTQQSQEVFAELSTHLARQHARLHQAETALGELDATLRSLNIPLIGNG